MLLKILTFTILWYFLFFCVFYLSSLFNICVSSSTSWRRRSKVRCEVKRREAKGSQLQTPSGPWSWSARSIVVCLPRATTRRWICAGSCSTERRGGTGRGSISRSTSTGSGRSGTAVCGSSTGRWRGWEKGGSKNRQNSSGNNGKEGKIWQDLTQSEVFAVM